MKTVSLLVSLNVFASLHAAPFTNGDFQTGFSGGTVLLPSGDSRLAGWQIGGDASIVWDGSITFPGTAVTSSWIEQTFDTIQGHQYRINYDLWVHGDGGVPSAVEIDVTDNGSHSLLSVTNEVGNVLGLVGFHQESVEFTATTPTTTLRFTHAFATDGSSRDTKIDNVIVFDLSAGPSLLSALYPGVLVAGQVGLTYNLQYSTPDAPANWQSAGTFVLDTSPKLVLVDTNSASAQRTYRAVLVP